LERRPGIHPTELDLRFADQRRAAIHELGEVGPAYVEALCQHVWDSLNDPKPMYASLIGQRAGVTGSGQSLIQKMLKRYLLELEDLGMTLGEPPKRAEFLVEADWHAAMLAHFKVIDEAVEALEEHYANYIIGSG
jgi:hypothetical protein